MAISGIIGAPPTPLPLALPPLGRYDHASDDEFQAVAKPFMDTGEYREEDVPIYICVAPLQS